MEPAETVKQIIHMPAWEIPARYQELRDILRALDVATIHALLAEGLAEHDRAIEQAGQPEPWLHAPDDSGLDLVLWIAQVRPDVCGSLGSQLWYRRVLGHGVLYRGADAATRDALLAEASTAVGDELNVMLRMLAWIGDDMVQRWFQARRDTLGDLSYLSADAYMSEGGWELSADGMRRELTFSVAYQLVDVEDIAAEEEGSESPVAVMTPYDGHCQWCGRRLTTLLDLDLRNPALAFLRLDGTRLRLVICEECSLWSLIYMNVDLAGGAHWSSHNAHEGQSYSADDGEMYFTPPDHRLGLGPRCASTTEVAARGIDWDISQVGGMPAWIQDAEYPPCPTCQRRMLFVGEVALEAITDRAIDGVFYGFLCPDCLLTTAIYQCT